MGDSQKIAPKNSPKIAKMIAIHQNCRRYCRKAILYLIWFVVMQAPRHPFLEARALSQSSIWFELWVMNFKFWY